MRQVKVSPALQVLPARMAQAAAAALLLSSGGAAAEEPASGGTSASQPADDSRPRLEAFFDDFDGFDGRRWYVSDGWSNGAHQNCTWSKSAVRVSDGRLILSFEPQVDGTYLCGEIQTRGRAAFGTMAARMRTARHSGLNAAFFTYIGPTHDQPHDEIDFEILTRDPGSVDLNTFVDGEARHGTAVPVTPPSDEAWHVYAMRWTPDGVVWSIDGEEVHRTPPDAAAEGTLPLHPQKIYLSHWGGETNPKWMGRFVEPSGPVEFEVDWVAYMPLGQECQFPQALSCSDR